MRDRNAPLTPADAGALAWDKMDGLLPAMVQHAGERSVLMLGYMNREALAATFESGFATFFSRSKQRLWQKGETSGNRVAVRSISADCDGDALLIHADPEGPTCHLGSASCFGETAGSTAFLDQLAKIVRERAAGGDEASYTAGLIAEGPARIAQKVGEEALEVALAAVGRDRDALIAETADLIYHLTVLMEAKGFGWPHVAAALEARHVSKNPPPEGEGDHA